MLVEEARVREREAEDAESEGRLARVGAGEDFEDEVDALGHAQDVEQPLRAVPVDQHLPQTQLGVVGPVFHPIGQHLLAGPLPPPLLRPYV